MIGPDRKDKLVQEAADGSELALTLLLKDSHRRLCDYVARKMPGGPQAAFEPEDIVQDTQVEAYRHIGSFKPACENAFDRWLYTIAIRKLRDAIKHHRRAKRGGGRAAAALNGGNREDSMIRLIDMLAGPGHTPSRVVARAEAASLMGRSERSVHGLLRRGLEKLREHLGRESRFLTVTG